MIDYSRLFHTGFLVDQLDEAMVTYGTALGLEWAPPAQLRGQMFWSPRAGLHTLDIEVTYSLQGPIHVELQRGPAGSFYDPSFHRAHHVGIWCEDLAGEVCRLERVGWSVAVAQMSPQDGFGLFVYLSPPVPGMMVELVAPGFRPLFDAWLAGENPFG